MRRAAMLIVLAACGSKKEKAAPAPALDAAPAVVVDANPLAPFTEPVSNLTVLESAPSTAGDIAPPCPDATWLVATGAHEYKVATCRNRLHFDVTVYQDGRAIGITEYAADAFSTPDFKEGTGALCVGGVESLGGIERPWAGCFHLNLKE